MALHRRFARSALMALVPLAVASAACSGASASDLGQPEPSSEDAPSSAAAPSDPPAQAAPHDPPGRVVDGGSEADAAPPACTTLVNVASEVSLIANASSAPPAAGGVIADGTYVVTSATLYTGPGGASGPTSQKVRMTIAIVGPRAESISDDVGRVSTLSTVGNELHSTTSCPGTGTDVVEFTATPTSLTIHMADGAGTRVYFLDKL